MVDWNLAFLISGAGYGINILVLLIISILIWLISLVIRGNKKANKQ
jgi:Na+-transporting methylmalonyl-CoA/oxaloacetate decarboxylase gamma subunit